MKEVDDLEVVPVQQILHEREALLGVNRVKRLQAVIRSGDHDVEIRSQTDQVFDQAGFRKGMSQAATKAWEWEEWKSPV